MNAELYNLADRMAAGVITPAERDQLEALLRDDDVAQREYVTYLDLHAQLHWNLRGPGSPGRVQGSGFRVQQQNNTPTLRPSPTGRGQSVWYAAALAAAVTIALTVWLVFQPEPRTLNPEPSPGSNAVAMLSDMSKDAVFAESSASMRARLGAELAPGLIHLTAGTAQVMFKSGAVVDLTGPCTFEMTGPNRGHLHRGRVEAFVRPEASGFTVASPVGVVTDLGTAFDFTCRPQGESTLSVIEGRVTFEPIAMAKLTLGAADELRLSVQPESMHVRRLTLRRAPATVGHVVGRAQANVPLGYQPQVPSAIIGVGGSITTRSRAASNAIIEFDLPDIETPLIEATLAVTKSEQNVYHDLPLAIVLSAVDPATSLDASLYAEGPVADDARTTVLTDQLLTRGDPIGRTARLDLLDYFRDRAAAAPVLRLRLSPDRPARLETIHRINIDAASARLTLVYETPGFRGPTERD